MPLDQTKGNRIYATRSADCYGSKSPSGPGGDRWKAIKWAGVRRKHGL